MPRGQGPAALLRRRGQRCTTRGSKRRYRVLDGDIPDLLIDDAETVDDAEDARLTKKAEADGIKPTFEQLTVTDIRSNFLDAVAGLPEQLAAAHEAAGAVPPTSLPERRRDPQHRRARHGRLGDLGRRRRGRVQRRAARADHGAEADPHARVRRARHARVRDVVLGRHRGDGLDGARARSRRARSSSRSRAAASSRRSRATRARCTCRARRVTCRARRSARWSRRCASRCSASVSRRARTRSLMRAQQQLARAARRVPARGRGRREPGARARAPDRSHDPADLRRRRARRGRRVPLEVRRQREREGARVLEHVSGARPQRDLRVGPARRRDPSAHHARRAPPRLRARAAAAALRRDARDHRRVRAPGARRSRPRARAGSRSSSTSCTSATG